MLQCDALAWRSVSADSPEGAPSAPQAGGGGCCATVGRCRVSVYGSLRKGSLCVTAVRRQTRLQPSSLPSDARLRTASRDRPAFGGMQLLAGIQI